MTNRYKLPNSTDLTNVEEALEELVRSTVDAGDEMFDTLVVTKGQMQQIRNYYFPKERYPKPKEDSVTEMTYVSQKQEFKIVQKGEE